MGNLTTTHLPNAVFHLIVIIKTKPGINNMKWPKSTRKDHQYGSSRANYKVMARWLIVIWGH